MAKTVPTNDLVGRNIRILRIYRGYSQEELADMCSISRSTMSKLENGAIKEISLQHITVLAGVLNVKESAILSFNPLYHMDPRYPLDPEDLSKEFISGLIRALSTLTESDGTISTFIKYFINILKISS